MRQSWNRRQFLHQVAGYGAAALAGRSLTRGICLAAQPSKVSDHKLTIISGKPRERGKEYGRKFKDEMHSFLDKEVYQVCSKYASREELLRYAGECTKAVKDFSPTILEELEGMAESADLKLEEVVLITLHEE